MHGLAAGATPRVQEELLPLLHVVQDDLQQCFGSGTGSVFRGLLDPDPGPKLLLMGKSYT